MAVYTPAETCRDNTSQHDNRVAVTDGYYSYMCMFILKRDILFKNKINVIFVSVSMNYLTMAQQPPVGKGLLIIEDS